MMKAEMKKEKGVWSMVLESKTADIEVQNGNLVLYDETVRDSYGKGYIYAVEALNEYGSSGYDTKGLAIYRLEVPHFTSAKVSGRSVTLTWNETDAHGYEVQYGTDGKTWPFAQESSSNEITLSLDADTQYIFRLRAKKANADRGVTWSQYSSWTKAVTGQ